MTKMTGVTDNNEVTKMTEAQGKRRILVEFNSSNLFILKQAHEWCDVSSSTGLFTHYCYANEVGRHTKPSKFWSDDGIQRTP